MENIPGHTAALHPPWSMDTYVMLLPHQSCFPCFSCLSSPVAPKDVVIWETGKFKKKEKLSAFWGLDSSAALAHWGAICKQCWTQGQMLPKDWRGGCPGQLWGTTTNSPGLCPAQERPRLVWATRTLFLLRHSGLNHARPAMSHMVHNVPV